MSYQVLARKWRPGNFDELVGQSHVLRAITSALDNERLHHAYLFTGTRGVGKTTISRILARCLNCEQGVTAKPCGTCSSCMEINEGRFVDLIEVDAASRTKVEDTRELLENVQYRPTRGRYKVYLIDEVHMLSTHSFNALLKTLEEPPPHVVFLLATTDPQKLPATVLSRCLQFHLKNMQPEDIGTHLAHILDTEAIEYELPALESISWSAKGSMRDALSLLDQAIAFGDGKVSDTDVREMLGTIDREQVYRMLSAIAANEGASCMSIIEDLSQFAPDYGDVLAELLSVLHRIALIQQIPGASMATQDQHQIELLAESIPAEDIQLFYQLALHGRRDLPLAPDQRSGFEMCMLRMMSFRPLGVTPAKKPESSNQKAIITAAVSSEVKPEMELELEPEHIQEQIPAPEMQDYHLTAVDEDERHFEDPRDIMSNENQTKTPRVNAPQVKTSKVDYISSPIKSPLVRDQLKSKPISSESVESPDSSQPEHKLIIPEHDIEGIKPELPEQESELLPTKVSQSNNDASAVKPLVPVEDGLPLVTDICQQNWYNVIETAALFGITEQLALNSQFIGFDGEHFELSLNHHVRSMVNPEHLNKLTAAINTLYNSAYTITILEQEPEYETPRERRERIQQERHQVACDNLTNDPQVQGLLKTFEASLNEDSVETLLPE